MRTLVIFVGFLFTTGLATVSAQSDQIPQTHEGRILLGGSIDALWQDASREQKTGGSLTSKSEDERRAIGLSPEASYFIDTNLALGIKATYRYRIDIDPKQPNFGDTSRAEDTRQTVRLGPTIRYYKPISDQLAFFGQASAFYEFGGGEREVDGTQQRDTDIMAFGGNVRPGITWFVSDKVGINFSIPQLVSYRYTEEEFKSEREFVDRNGNVIRSQVSTQTITSSDFNLNLDLSRVSVGVNVFL